jgi:hypothetical protein
MDLITFVVRPSDQWFGDEIDIEINDESLVAKLQRHELPFAQAEGSPSIAGSYSGLPACAYLDTQRWLGQTSQTEARDRVELLLCRDCGEIGCWPILAKITAEEEQVTWSDFQQPHRTGGGNTPMWDYRGFGPFVFDRVQYEQAIETAARSGRTCDRGGVNPEEP